MTSQNIQLTKVKETAEKICAYFSEKLPFIDQAKIGDFRPNIRTHFHIINNQMTIETSNDRATYTHVNPHCILDEMLEHYCKFMNWLFKSNTDHVLSALTGYKRSEFMTKKNLEHCIISNIVIVQQGVAFGIKVRLHSGNTHNMAFISFIMLNFNIIICPLNSCESNIDYELVLKIENPIESYREKLRSINKAFIGNMNHTIEASTKLNLAEIVNRFRIAILDSWIMLENVVDNIPGIIMGFNGKNICAKFPLSDIDEFIAYSCLFLTTVENFTEDDLKKLFPKLNGHGSHTKHAIASTSTESELTEIENDTYPRFQRASNTFSTTTT